MEEIKQVSQDEDASKAEKARVRKALLLGIPLICLALLWFADVIITVAIAEHGSLVGQLGLPQNPNSSFAEYLGWAWFGMFAVMMLLVGLLMALPGRNGQRRSPAEFVSQVSDLRYP